MTTITYAMVWTADNVTKYKGFEVSGGEVTLSDSEYVDFLNELHGDVIVCGQEFRAGDLFKDADPTAFDCGKGDYENELQGELETDLENEDESDITFDKYEPFEIDDEDTEEGDDD